MAQVWSAPAKDLGSLRATAPARASGDSRIAFDVAAESPYDEQVGPWHTAPAVARARIGGARSQSAKLAPSFNGRTAASGAAYRGSNPWGATNVAILVVYRLAPT